MHSLLRIFLAGLPNGDALDEPAWSVRHREMQNISERKQHEAAALCRAPEACEEDGQGMSQFRVNGRHETLIRMNGCPA